MEGDLYRTLSIITFSILLYVNNARCESEDEIWNSIVRPGGRYYSFSTCAYGLEAGYTCLSCSRALHCYPSNFAIFVDCPLMLPYCRNGRCSRTQGEKCFEEQKVSTSTPDEVVDKTTASNNENIADSTTSYEDKVTLKDELISEVQENLETITETASEV